MIQRLTARAADAGSATGSAVELLPEDVRVSGVPRGLARHVGHDPPERVPVAVDRDGETRFRVAGGTDRAVAVLDCLSRAKGRTLALSWCFRCSSGRSPVLVDQAVDDVGALDPGGHIDRLAWLM